MTAKLAIGWVTGTNAKDVDANDLSNVLTSPGPLKVPSHTGNDRIAIWYADELGDLSDIHMLGGAVSERNTFGRVEGLVKDGINGKVIVTIARRISHLLSGEEYALTFSGE